MLLAKMSIGKRIACSRLSDSGVRREEREREKIRRKRGREEPRSRPTCYRWFFVFKPGVKILETF